MKISVTDLSGYTQDIEAVEGWRLMEILREYGFPVKAECGGACACATCHVYIDHLWITKLPGMRADEQDMLDSAFDVRSNSRLSCQIILDETMDGLRVTLAPNPD